VADHELPETDERVWNHSRGRKVCEREIVIDCLMEVDELDRLVAKAVG